MICQIVRELKNHSFFVISISIATHHSSFSIINGIESILNYVHELIFFFMKRRNVQLSNHYAP